VPVSPDSSGYLNNSFSGKQDQLLKVSAYVLEKGFIPKEFVEQEVSWFYTNLGIDDLYFQKESIETIAQHILSLYSAKIFAFVKNQNQFDINLERETDDGAVYIHSSQPGVSQLTGPQHEKRIDSKYLDSTTLFRLESFRSFGATGNTQIRCYFISKCVFCRASSKRGSNL